MSSAARSDSSCDCGPSLDLSAESSTAFNTVQYLCNNWAYLPSHYSAFSVVHFSFFSVSEVQYYSKPMKLNI